MLFRKHILSTRARRHEERQAELYRSLIRREAKLGGELFGQVPHGTRREFFCLDEHTWVWHEEWVDTLGHQQIRTTRYDVRPTGILKAQNGQPYQKVSQEEAVRLVQAIHNYEQKIRTELYTAYL